MQTEMNNFKSYRTWIPSDSNTVEGRIPLYTVACYLTDGIQADVFSFESDAYLYLADQVEGLTDAQRAELEQRAKSSNYEAFLALFHELVSPVTSYRIEPHVLQVQRELF